MFDKHIYRKIKKLMQLIEINENDEIVFKTKVAAEDFIIPDFEDYYKMMKNR